MKRKNVTSRMIALTMIGAGWLTVGCSSDSSDEPTPTPPTTESDVFHVVYGADTNSNESTSVMLPFTDLTQGTIDFTSKGFEISKSRTDRVYTSEDGKTLYSLQYQDGTIKKISYVSQNEPYYIEQKSEKKDLKGILGDSNIRWKKISDTEALAYNIVRNQEKNDDGTHKRTVSKLIIVRINLSNYDIIKADDITFDVDEDTTLPDLHVWRVDSPVVHNGKVYIGVAKRGFDGKNNVNDQTYKTSTLVLDYPSLTNAKFIYSEKAKGEAYGYRTASYFAHDGSVYHNSTNETKILKITDGKYDDDYVIDLATQLGLDKVGASGMFYVGDGIAYINYYDATKGRSWGDSNKYWGVARIDLKNKTAVKMELGLDDRLWLAPNQSAKLGKDGKFYMALAPVDGDGNIYIFDPKSSSPTAFTKGATLKVAGGASYLGVF